MVPFRQTPKGGRTAGKTGRKTRLTKRLGYRSAYSSEFLAKGRDQRGNPRGFPAQAGIGLWRVSVVAGITAANETEWSGQPDHFLVVKKDIYPSGRTWDTEESVEAKEMHDRLWRASSICMFPGVVACEQVLLNDAGHIIKGIFCEMSDRNVVRTSRMTGHKPKGELSFACA